MMRLFAKAAFVLIVCDCVDAVGRFSYDDKDWCDVKDAGDNIWRSKLGMNNFKKNECCKNSSKQSPKDLKQNSKCKGDHKILLSKGNCSNKSIKFEITPWSLRGIYPTRGCRPPSADVSDSFHERDAFSFEMKAPSEHKIKGKRYDAELSVSHVKNTKRVNRGNRSHLVTMFSVLIKADGNKKNRLIEDLISEWKDHAKKREKHCKGKIPTASPTATPTTAAPTKCNTPTLSPSVAPSDAPSVAPTKSPSVAPTESPSVAPTESPSDAPSDAPTESPSDSPTDSPTKSPTDSPTKQPTKSPTDSPTKQPTDSLTGSPTGLPMESSTAGFPENKPETSPSDADAVWGRKLEEGTNKTATPEPTYFPTTVSPTAPLTEAPTASPTDPPTEKPTASPITKAPSPSPTSSPTKHPSANPSSSPTRCSDSPSASPSDHPSASPSAFASAVPTAMEDLRDMLNTNSTLSERRRRRRLKIDIHKPWNEEYYYGYKGSITVPPCTNNVFWYVADKPITMSKNQLKAIKTLLASYRNENCELDSYANSKGEVARPIQNNRGSMFKCDKGDYKN